MCRVFIPEDVENKLRKGEEMPSLWENLYSDAIGLSKLDLCEGTGTSEGYSVMLFGSNIKNPAKDGVLREEFFKKYEYYSMLAKENIGWELINSFPDSHKESFSLSKNMQQYYNLKFLNFQTRNPIFSSSIKTPGAKILQLGIEKLA